MIYLKIIDRLKNSYKDKDYYISVYNNGIYIMNYESIKLVNNDLVEVLFKKFIVIIKGSDLKIKRKDKFDLELSGNFSSMEINSESRFN